MAKIILDREKCVGCGSCVAVAPELFKLNEQDFKSELIKEGELSDDELQKAKESVSVCPAGAIEVSE